MRTDDFDFNLPQDRIALRPARPREAARLLVAPKDGPVEDHVVRDLPHCLRPGDLLVVNDTRVIRAALTGERAPRATGGGVSPVTVSVNLHERVGPSAWRAFAQPAKRLRVGDVVTFAPEVAAEVTALGAGGEATLAFTEAGAALDAVIAETGAPPLPPYIARRRPVDDADADDYQTMFAVEGDSVAAPTAGLHFTTDLVAALRDRGVRLSAVTLHVGAGTFLPVKAHNVRDHVMHEERYSLSAETAAAIAETRAAGGRVVAVGTTSLRTLETCAGDDGVVRAGAGATGLFITPGYAFRAVDGLMTNFHLPKSTLFMLVCAFSGVARMKAAYAHAIAAGYRFYSYGDACLLWRR